MYGRIIPTEPREELEMGDVTRIVFSREGLEMLRTIGKHEGGWLIVPREKLTKEFYKRLSSSDRASLEGYVYRLGVDTKEIRIEDRIIPPGTH